MPIPIVQSGPNKGKERSRNKNGQWRKKRTVRSSWRNTDKNGSDIDEIM